MLQATNLTKTFVLPDGTSSPVLNDVTFSVEQGRFFTLLGPSGCGKTTLLRSIVGLEEPDGGRITIDGKPMFDAGQGILVPASRRRIGMVFQSYAIWPHMDVFENVAFPLRVSPKRVREQEVTQRVRRALATVHMEEFERRPATRLSGGQQQRLAMARALIMEPSLLLLDEPLSNLDAKLREAMRVELRRLQRESGITTVYVTHDQTEALALSDTIAVMDGGRIIQQGDPRTIYKSPVTRFIAEFIGSTNLLPATVEADTAVGGEAAVNWRGSTLKCVAWSALAPRQDVLISIRPEEIQIARAGAKGNGASAAGTKNRLLGKVVEQVFLGNTVDSLIQIGDSQLRVWSHPSDTPGVGTEVGLEIEPASCVVLKEDPGRPASPAAAHPN